MAPGHRTATASALDADDPVWQAVLAAPVDDSPIPEEEALALEEASKRNFWIDGAVVSAEIAAARQPVIPEDDPLWQAFLNAPIDDEPETEEERLAIAEAKREGVFIDGATVTAMIAARAAREG